MAIGTDRLHYASDLLLNGSVILALVLDQSAGLTGADALFGLLIALLVAVRRWNGVQPCARPADGPRVAETTCATLPRSDEGISRARRLHDLRTRSSGTHRFVQFHVWVPADWTVSEAHERLDRVEEQLQERFPGTEILIHLDPEGQVDRETMLSSAITES